MRSAGPERRARQGTRLPRVSTAFAVMRDDAADLSGMPADRLAAGAGSKVSHKAMTAAVIESLGLAMRAAAPMPG